MSLIKVIPIPNPTPFQCKFSQTLENWSLSWRNKNITCKYEKDNYVRNRGRDRGA